MKINYKNTLRSFAPLLILSLLSSYCLGQTPEIEQLNIQLSKTKNDSTKLTVLADLCWEYRILDPRKAINIADKSMKLASELKDSFALKRVHRYIVESYLHLNEVDSAIYHCNLALKIHPEHVLSSAKVQQNFAIIFEHEGQYGKAAEHYYKSMKLMEKAGYSDGLNIVKYGLAIAYLRMRDSENALKYAIDVLKYFRNSLNQEYIAKTQVVIGDAYMLQKQYEKALTSFNESLEISLRTGNPKLESMALDALGSLYQEKGDYDKALELLKRALIIDEPLNNKFNIAIAHGRIAAVYLEKGDQLKALEHNRIALLMAKENGYLHLLLSAAEHTAQSYYENGDFHAAHELRLLYEEIKDSIYSEKQSAQIIDITKKYETEKKEQEIDRLNSERKITESKVFFKNLLLALMGVLIVVMVITTILYFRMRKAREQKKINDIENKALRAQMNPHFIFNCLNSIQRLYVEGKEDLANDYMADFSSLLRKILENSGMEKISLKKEIESTMLYLDLEKMRTDHLFDYDISIDPSIDLLNRFVPPLILQPYVENAIWHGIVPKNDKGQIKIVITQNENNELACTISDDGVGFSNKNNKLKSNNSKGMSITEKRLGGEKSVQIIEPAEGGVTIKLKIQ